MRDFHYDDYEQYNTNRRSISRGQRVRQQRFLAELEYELELEYEFELELKYERQLEREAMIREELWLEERIYRACLVERDRPRRQRRATSTRYMPQYERYEESPSRYRRRAA